MNQTTPATPPCACCGDPATRQSADGVPLCEGDYQHLLEHDAEALGHHTAKAPQLAPRGS